MEFQITLYHDLRRSKNGEVFPVKIRVWNRITSKAKLYTTTFDLTINEFKNAWLNKRITKEFRELNENLQALERKAKDSANEITLFSFDEFERKLFRKKGEGINIIYHYKEIIKDLTKRGQIGTASNYDLSLKSILVYYESLKGKIPNSISFYEITSDWLKDYEYFMTKKNDRSLTTVSIYLRSLRAIYNKAIAENEIKIDIYPFGKRKYQMPQSKNVKKALEQNELRKLFDSTPKTPEQEKAKDFWFFSYFCNGMNIKDIALLRFKDLGHETITFYRAKTLNTSKGNLKPITVYFNDFIKSIIPKYGLKNLTGESFVFDIIKPNSTPQQEKKDIQNFTRFINQHIKKLCKDTKLPEISTYWARHSFTTNSVRNGASMEFIQESLGHGNLKTTLNYFAGFENKTKKEFAKKLMEF